MGDKRNRGSITIETLIRLTLFIMFFVLMLNFINIAFIQIKIQHALVNTSYELSVMSYMGTKASERGGTASGDDYMSTIMHKVPRDGPCIVYTQDSNMYRKLYLLGENPDLLEEMVEKLMSDYLSQYINKDAYLERQGVAGGINGLHYDLSEYNPEEGYIRVSVYYKYRVASLPFLNAGIDINIFQNSTSRLWQ